jgi:hypothetical protein
MRARSGPRVYELPILHTDAHSVVGVRGAPSELTALGVMRTATGQTVVTDPGASLHFGEMLPDSHCHRRRAEASR